MEIALAQLRPVPGDLERNAHSILRAVDDAARAGASLVVTSAHALTGAISADHAADPTFSAAAEAMAADLAARLRGLVVAIGALEAASGELRERVRLLREGAVAPYPPACHGSLLVHQAGDTRFAFVAADDALADAASAARRAGAHALVALAASPYRVGIHERRQALTGAAAARASLPVYLVNAVGADGSAIFDGASFVTDATGALVQQVPAWHATVAIARLSAGVPVPVRGRLDAERAAHAYEALVLALREAAARIDARDAIVEADDALDGALALALARDAFGMANVRRWTDLAGQHDAGAPSRTLRIDACNRSTLVLRGTGARDAERTRFNLLADLSRTFELAVARYRNVIGRVMPESVVEDASAAVHAPWVGGIDAEAADAMIAGALEDGLPREELVARGYPPAAVDAALHALRAGGLSQPLVRITPRPADAVLARPAQ